MQAKNAADSAFNNVRTLFNNSKSGAYYYYWLLKSCSFKVPSNQSRDECPDFDGRRYGNQWPGELRASYGKFRDPLRLFGPIQKMNGVLEILGLLLEEVVQIVKVGL